MKTFAKTFILLFLIGVTFSGCEEIKSLADVKFNSELSGDINVSVPAIGLKSATLEADFPFDESASINPRDDSEIDKYFDKLKSFDVTQIKGTFKNVSTSTPVKILSGTISVSSGSTVASWPIADYEVADGKSITLDNANGQWDKVNTILDNKNAFKIRIVGETSEGGVSFTLTIVINIKVTANPL